MSNWTNINYLDVDLKIDSELCDSPRIYLIILTGAGFFRNVIYFFEFKLAPSSRSRVEYLFRDIPVDIKQQSVSMEIKVSSWPS